MTKEEFKSKLRLTVEAKIIELIAHKQGKKCISYQDAMIVTHRIRHIFDSALGFIPNEIERACLLSDAIVAPSQVERMKLIKKAASLTGGAAGVIMLLSAMATALGWGTGVKASITAFFVGTSSAGPIGTAVAGAVLIVIAGYFIVHGGEEKRMEKYKKALVGSLDGAVDAIWDEHSEKLSTIKIRENGSNR